MKERVLFSRENIALRTLELGNAITLDYGEEEIVVVALLRGGFIFAADLVREIKGKVCIDFMTTSSYGVEKVCSGDVQIVSDIGESVAGRHVLIVDDIVDSGYTLKRVYQIFEDRGAKSVKSCVLLNKQSKRAVDFEPDYYGFLIDDYFVVGYGLNYGKHYRNIPYVFAYEE